MNKNSYTEDLTDTQKGYLALPIDKEQLADFIKGLLGSSQKIRKRINGVFEIQMSDLQNFNELVIQRTTQNKSSLIEFCATIYFSDNSSVQMHSFEELLTYNEIKPIVSDAIRLNWTFLIEFPNKNFPEKQSIELYYCAREKKVISIEGKKQTFTLSYFQIEIQHSNRTWGTDLENTLSNQINSISKKTRSKTRDYFIKTCTFLGVFIIVSGIYFNSALKFIDDNRNAKIKEIEAYIESIDSDDLTIKIDNLISAIIHEGMPNYERKVHSIDTFNIHVIGWGLALLMAYISYLLVFEHNESHLVLTRKSKEIFDKYIKKKKRDWVMLIISLSLGIFASLLASYIFSILSSYY